MQSEWYNTRIQRIVIETGEVLSEDKESGLGRKGGSEKLVTTKKRRETLIVRNPKRRGVGQGQGGEEVNNTQKRRKLESSVDMRVRPPNEIEKGVSERRGEKRHHN